jgi:flagellar hook-basal body complex protein FliE
MTLPISNLSIPSPTAKPTGKATGAREWGFVETLRGAMDQVSELQNTADGKVSELLQGNGMDVHSAMIAVQKADLSFQLMMQVRNKIVQAYQEISRMQF